MIRHKPDVRKSPHWSVFRGILAFCLVLSSIVASALGRTSPILSEGDHVWFATEYGLYRYSKSQDEWSIFSAGSGLAGNDIRDIGTDEGIIWIATDGGVSNSDVRFSDWRSYAIEDGLPSNDVRCVAFSEDYVWIGTGDGAARFDKLLEEWESYTQADGLAGDEVNDIAVDGDTVWFATSSGVSEFEIEFDKWTTYISEVELPSTNVTWALIAGEYTWFVTDKGLARYDKRLRSWKSYGVADGIVSYSINDVIPDGDKIWIATEDGVSSYDPLADSWTLGLDYHAMLPSKNVVDLALDGEIVWFCTDNGVSSYNSETGVWRHYTTADGLLDNHCQGIIVSGQVLVTTEKGVNLYDKSTQEWDTYQFSRETAVAGPSERGFRLDDQGIGFDLSREAQVRLSGSSSMEYAGEIDLNPDRHSEYERDRESDLSLRGTIPGGRSVVGFYDDTDEDDIEYGLTYRGADADLFQEATAGEFEARMRNSDLIDDMNLAGAGARLRKGVGKARLNVEPRYGQQSGFFETDFFVYRTGRTVYELSHQNVIPGTDEVEAGKERLQSGVDYLIVYPSGWLVFHREELVEEGENIEIRYQYEPSNDQREEHDVAILTTGLDMGSDYYAGMDMLHRDDLDVISLNGEGKNMKLGPVSMKMRPEMAYSRWQNDADTMNGIASKGEFIANAPRTQFKADYERYDEDFWTIGRRGTRFGELDRHLRLFSQVDIAQWMPLTMRWERERSSDDDMVNTLEDDFRMNVVVSKKPYPTIALTGERNVANSPEHDESENAARADFQYELPKSLLSLARFRKADVNAYYREARGESTGVQDRIQTGYAKFNLYPLERFVVSTSYWLNRAQDRGTDLEPYNLREDLQRLLIRSDFAAIKGVLTTFDLDDTSFQSRSEDGNLEKDEDRFLAASLNLIPGVWTQRLKMLTFTGRYSLIQQTVQINSSDPESEEDERADSNARSLRLQTNLMPHKTLLWTGIYERIKNWIEGVPPLGNIRKYRSEAEFKPGSKNRIVLEYRQENEDEDNTLQKRLYSPSLWWEIRWSPKWTTRFRSIYERSRTRENGEISEKASTLTPSLSFRYTAKELPHGGRLYLSQGFSVSVHRAERNARESTSETYSTSLVVEWKLTRNLSLRLRGSVSYEDDRTQDGEDRSSANIYTRALARF
ncbi:hypothetical protein ACFL6S_33455 [Candidatus Poribacteria bacterium]